jgi:hypothetical protein
METYHVGTIEELSCIDNNLQCHHEDYEEATVEQIAAKHQKMSGDQKSGE